MIKTNEQIKAGADIHAGGGYDEGTQEEYEAFLKVRNQSLAESRIDNLLWQAGGFTKLNYPNDTFLDGRYALTQEQLDKFAELIVRECAVELMKLGNSYSECDTDADYMQGLLDGADIIKEHFGIDSESEIEYCPKCNIEWSGTSCGIPNCGWITGAEE